MELRAYAAHTIVISSEHSVCFGSESPYVVSHNRLSRTTPVSMLLA